MTEPTNQIDGDVNGNAVQAGHVDSVHIGPRIEQRATSITNFAGPIHAPGAHFGATYGARDDEEN